MDFKEIYEQFAPQVFRVCMGYANDRELARDLTQETFIGVWRGLPDFRHESRLSTWIFRIATNTCLRALEKSRRLVSTELPSELSIPDEDSDDKKLAYLYQCIAELEESDRIIISLDLEGVQQAEIAAIVGISHSNVRTKIHRIKGKLTIKFKRHGQFE